MAYLTAEERDKLRDELKDLKIGRAKGRVKGMDKKSRLVLYRNMQRVGEYTTTFELPSLGVKVALIEGENLKTPNDRGWTRRQWELVDVVVSPTPDNKA